MELNDIKLVEKEVSKRAPVIPKDLELYDVVSDVCVVRRLTDSDVNPNACWEDFVGIASVKRHSTGEVFDALLLSHFFRVFPDYVSKGMQVAACISNNPEDKQRLDVIAKIAPGEKFAPFLAARIANYNIA